MALFTLIKYVLGFFVGFLVFIVAGPLQYLLRYQNTMWDNMPTFMQAWGDQMYGIWVLMIVIIAAVLVIAGINEANKNRNLEA